MHADEYAAMAIVPKMSYEVEVDYSEQFSKLVSHSSSSAPPRQPWLLDP